MIYSLTLLVTTGANNDNEEEKGNGRGANCPHERLNYQLFPALLSLE